MQQKRPLQSGLPQVKRIGSLEETKRRLAELCGQGI